MTQKPAPFILCLAFALACGAELPAPAGELEELTKRHTAALSRDGAPGYPRGWSLRPCTFVDELLRPGAGTSAAGSSSTASSRARGIGMAGDRGVGGEARGGAWPRR